MPRLDIGGVFVPTATPFDAAGEVDLEAFRDNLRWWLSAPISGLVVGGSTGEAVLLDEDERVALWRTAREELDDDRLLIAGTGAESARASLRLAKSAADAGADALLVQPPAFFRGAMSAEALTAHFTALAEQSPIPVILYQVPLKFSTLDFDNGWIAEMSRHERIIGIKDSRGKMEHVRELVATCHPDFQILVGNGAIFGEALEAGAVGAILGVANLLPAECCEIHQAHRAGDVERRDAVQGRVAPVHTAIIGGMGVPGVKHALDRLGRRGGSPRPPLHPLAADRHAEVASLVG